MPKILKRVGETQLIINMGSDVGNINSLLMQAQRRLEIAKEAKVRAKANGDYAARNRGTKTCVDGKSLNFYDYNIYVAQKSVKEYKAKLAEAKKAAKKK